METLISENFIRYSNRPFSPVLSQFRSTSLKSRFFLKFSNRKLRLDSKKPIFCSISASNSTNFGGWDELNLIDNSEQSGKFDQFQNFLISVGIDDRKHFFMFLLGFVSALAISRVKVSSILVFPASVLVLSVGFSLGFVRGGSVGFLVKDISRNGSKKTSKEENSRLSAEKLRNLVEYFSKLDVKITNLKKEMKGSMESNSFQVGELEGCHNVIKSISLDILPAKKLVEALINDMGVFGSVGDSSGESVDGREVERSLNQKSSRRKSVLDGSSFDFFQFISGLFQENSIGAKPNKVKDTVKREFIEPSNSKVVNNQIHGSILAQEVEEKVLNTVSDNNIGQTKTGSSPQEASNNPALNQLGADKLGDGAGKTELIPGMVKGNSPEMVRNINTLLNYEEFSHPNNSLRFMDNHGNFMKTGHQNKNEMQLSRDNLLDPLDLGVNMRGREIELGSFTTEAKPSLQQEQTLKTSNGAYMPSYDTTKRENGSYHYDFRERRTKSEDTHNLDNHRVACDMEVGSTSASSMISEDVEFDRHLTEATNLLKQARECLKGKVDEQRAEVILHKSARLLSRAISMKPMSLLAVGQLGNTFLLHGELKLKTSRELRTLLSGSESVSRERGSREQVKGLNDQVMSKDRMASVLIDVCEECEELLVEAGRKYRMALSIDGSDVRALYNWGLALSYRAQLIADIGPEAAFDADQVYLAAIDKFDAMMSRSNAYAPDALFRWGVALQQRSRLRPSNSKEKIKLLHQAKRLFEDALCIDSNNIQVRESLSSCISELNYRHL